MPARFRDGRLCTPVRTEAVTARVERRLEHRRQHLVHGLLNPAIHHIGDAETALTATRLRDPDPAYIAWPVLPREQLTTQRRQQPM